MLPDLPSKSYVGLFMQNPENCDLSKIATTSKIQTFKNYTHPKSLK